MKKKNVFFVLLTFVVFGVMSQSQHHKWSIGLNGGLSDFIGDIDNHKVFNINRAFRGQLGLNAYYNLNPWFSFGFDYTTGKMGHWVDENDFFRSHTHQAHIALRMNLNNGRIISEDSRLQPYLFAGIGAVHFGSHSKSDSYNAFLTGTLNSGLGFTVIITERLGFNYNIMYAYT
jgi:OOP family OmpA-OmpF porin